MRSLNTLTITSTRRVLQRLFLFKKIKLIFAGISIAVFVVGNLAYSIYLEASTATQVPELKSVKPLYITETREPEIKIEIQESEFERQKRLQPKVVPQKKKVVRDVIARSTPVRFEGTTSDVQDLARDRVVAVWGDRQWPAFRELIQRESGWRVGARNGKSGACGLPQALPCSKLGSAYGNPEGEVSWAIGYISRRYHTPEIALAHQKSHGWY